MPARAISSATISFGLVSIPIKLYSSNAPSNDVSFNLLHKKCGTKLKQQYTCPVDNEVVERDEMVKGYEFQKGRYVTFTEEELKALEEEATKSIEITEFVPAAKVDPMYFEKTYYLGPDKGGDKPYKLLCAAMKETGRSALATYAARGKQYLVLVRATDGGLVMQQLRHADEIRPFSEVPVGEAEVRDTELKLAMQLVEQIASNSFAPEKYQDEVKKRVLAQIQQKVEGKEITLAQPETPKAQIIDLMAALRASLGQAGPGANDAAPPGAEDEQATRKPAKRVGGKEGAAKAPRAKRSTGR
jgi:DNA end-binding protein Ku